MSCGALLSSHSCSLLRGNPTKVGDTLTAYWYNEYRATSGTQLKKGVFLTMTNIAHPSNVISRDDWLKLGAMAAVAAIVGVLVVQAIAVFLWPEIVLFKPLESYARSALFTLVPAVGATIVFAWLAARQSRPVKTFLQISAVVLAVSIIPDYLLPVPHKTFLASSMAALLHGVAAVITVGVLVGGYRRRTGQDQD